MSLMSILKSSDPKCKEVKEIIKSVAPQKKDFKTYSGIPPFTNYEVMSEHKLTSSYDSGLVGTAFDYLSKIICAYYTNTELSAKEFEQPKIISFLEETALLHKDLKCKAPLIEPNLRRNLGKWST